MEHDKFLHITVSAFIAFTATIAVWMLGVWVWLAMYLGYSISVSVGVAKEYYDSLGHGTPDIGDVFADVIGSIMGAILGGTVCGLILYA